MMLQSFRKPVVAGLSVSSQHFQGSIFLVQNITET